MFNLSNVEMLKSVLYLLTPLARAAAAMTPGNTGDSLKFCGRIRLLQADGILKLEYTTPSPLTAATRLEKKYEDDQVEPRLICQTLMMLLLLHHEVIGYHHSLTGLWRMLSYRHPVTINRTWQKKGGAALKQLARSEAPVKVCDDVCFEITPGF